MIFFKNVVRLSLCLAMGFVSLSASADTLEQQKKGEVVETVVCQETFYFEYGQSQLSDAADYAKANSLVVKAKENPKGLINIKGWADANGSQSANEAIAIKRALTISDYLVNNGIDASRITYAGMGVDSSSSAQEARRVDVSVTLVEPKAQKPAPKPAPKPAESKVQEVETVKEEVVEAVEEEATTQVAAVEEVAAAQSVDAVAVDPCQLSIRTNALYWLGGLANVGLEWNPKNTKLGVVINGGYSPFSSESWDFNNGGWFVSPEIRYYLGAKERWFLGIEYLTGGVDIKTFDTFSTRGREGNVNCIGLMGGYKLEFTDTFGMDFTLGLGYSSFKYDIYTFDDDLKIRETVYTGCHLKKFTPIQAGVNLIWKL